jgi:hypothetical protein
LSIEGDLGTAVQVHSRHRAPGGIQKEAQETNLAKACGINGIPVLSYVPGIIFPNSFPGDIMHIASENIIPGLLDNWCLTFKDLDEGCEEYGLAKKILEAIGDALKASSSTVPSSFGCRVPNIMTERHHFTAEAWNNWTMLFAPVLLHRRFKKDVYYNHFVKLVRLLDMCYQVNMATPEVDEVESGLAAWVQEYEQ